MGEVANTARRRIRLPWLLVVAALMGVSTPSAIQSASAAGRPRAHVVIAVVGEVGANVYHRDFAAPKQTSYPGNWLPGYPKGAAPLRLHLGEPNLRNAIAADDRTWQDVRPNRLYYIPGTRFAGVVYLPSPLDRSGDASFDSNNPAGTLQSPRPIIGNTDHGTGVASVAAGTRFGTCPDCDLVLVAADNPEDGLAWAAKQPWIDIISNSWGGLVGTPTRAMPTHPDRAAQPSSEASRAAAASGHAVLFASGNGVSALGPATHGTQHSLTWDSPFAGPPWVLTVGASKPVTDQPTDWHNVPVDLIAQGEARPAADYSSTDGEMTFSGTSCSTPITAGVLGEALYRARSAAGDAHVGVSQGALLLNPRAASPAGRRVTYLQLFDAAKAVATWHTFDPRTLANDPFLTPTTQAGYAYEGYGVLDRQSVSPLVNVLLGRAPRPGRPEMARWAQLDEEVRSQIWGAAPNPVR